MRLVKGFKVSALVAIAVPAILALTAITTLADASPGNTALPGDPTRGATLYLQNCTSCHGVNLEGGIGATLNPIDKLPGIANPLDAAFLLDVITNGRKHQPGDPKQTDMPPLGGNTNLAAQDVKDLAAYIIQQNQLGAGTAPLAANELAKRTMTWVGIGIIGLLFITYLLAQYNMRWIARRAAARHNK
jgi:mono/diheme cytochrome c family protein